MNIPGLESILIDTRESTASPASLVGRPLGDVFMTDLLAAAMQDRREGDQLVEAPLNILEEPPDGDSTYI